MTADYEGCGYLIRADLLQEPSFPAAAPGAVSSTMPHATPLFVCFGDGGAGGGVASTEARWASDRETKVGARNGPRAAIELTRADVDLEMSGE